MLLRLLPLPTEATPAPPTILFTLPLPTHPYTSRSLPLPPNLLAHRSVCLQEDIECPNVLLGEKSSWITGVSPCTTLQTARTRADEISYRSSTTSHSPFPPRPSLST
jgi:hypothetical protein